MQVQLPRTPRPDVDDPHERLYGTCEGHPGAGAEADGHDAAAVDEDEAADSAGRSVPPGVAERAAAASDAERAGRHLRAMEDGAVGRDLGGP